MAAKMRGNVSDRFGGMSMDANKLDRLGQLLERELSDEEKERLRRIQDVLGIESNDGLWDVIIAMEYQRNYYDELPKKISGAATEIFQKLSLAAENEVALAQSRLAESVVEQAKKLSLKTHVHTWLLWGIFVLILLLFYGSLLLWAGYAIGSGQTHPPALLLHMPVGIIIGALCFCCGIFSGALAARNFAEGDARWRQGMLTACGFLLPGGGIVGLALF